MTIEQDVKDQAKEIRTLENSMIKIAAVVENNEKRHGELIDTVKRLSATTERVERGLSEAITLQKDFINIQKDVSRLEGETRENRHSIGEVKNAIPGIQHNREHILKIESFFNNKMETIDRRVATLENTNNIFQSATDTNKAWVKQLWVVLGPFVIGFLGWLIANYVQHKYTIEHKIEAVENVR